jgi:hypothetical protein
MRELDRLCESYGDLLRHLDPAAANAAGFVSAGGRLGRFDRDAIREHVAAFRATAAAIEELEVEDLADEIDRTALLDDVRVTIARLEEDHGPDRNPQFWIDHLARSLASLVFPVGPAGAAGLVDCVAAIPTFVASARATLHRPPHLLVDWALAELGPVGELLVHAATLVAAGVRDPAEPDTALGEADAFNATVRNALQALTGFGHWLRSEIEPEPGLAGAVLGEERFERRLHHRYAVRDAPAKLGRYAARLLDETEAALVAEARNSSSADGWRDLLVHAEQEMVPAVPALGEALERVRGLVGETGVPVPSAPEILVAPPFLRFLFPRVTYLAAPPPLDSDAARLVLPVDRSSRSSVPAIAAAGLAGRHLQESTAQTLGSRVRQSLRAPIAVEGWALYTEGWMAELGLYVEADERAFRLVHLLRAAGRLAVDVGIHAGGMTADDAIALLTDRAAFSRGNAELELRCCLAHPTDGSAAALGRREILALRAAAGAATSGAALDRFHADLLQYGALPPGLAGWGIGLPA